MDTDTAETVLNAELIEQMVALLPAEQQVQLVALLMDEEATDEQFEVALEDALTHLDWQTQEENVRALIGRIMPLETFVPDVYSEWRPVVRDAVAYVGSRLTPKRLIPKLIEQLRLPPDLPLEQRLLVLIAQMPALQKLGQLLARHPQLDASLRAELVRLENAIQDITPAEIRATVQSQLSTELQQYQVELQEVLLAEASVSAVVRFTWVNPATQQRENGVFKVLKPYITDYLPEELNILHALADFFDINRDHYDLPPVAMRKVLDEVRELLVHEINLPEEQAALMAAAVRYRDVPGIRIPQLIQPLSTPTITAMSEEAGVKVTDAFQNRPLQRAKLVTQLIEALIAIPLFAPEEDSFFHADLHAGNLIVNEQTGEATILDWALVGTLSREQRRQIVLLTAAVGYRDSQRTYQAIARITSDDLRAEPAKAALVRGKIAQFLDTLPPWTLPEFTQVISLVDSIALAGVTFPSEMLTFRKTLFTLVHILQEIAPWMRIDLVLGLHVVSLLAQETPTRLRHGLTDNTIFQSLLSNHDLTTLVLNLPLLGNRLWLQLLERLTHNWGNESVTTLTSTRREITA